MPALSDIIDDTFPGSGDVGVPLQSAITVLFDRAMDHTELQLDFFIEGPDTDQFIGPGLLELTSPANISQGDLDNFLRSPGYAGLVQGVFTFKYISLTDVNEFGSKLLKKGYIQGLVYGNVTEEQARENTSLLKNKLNIKPEKW